MLGGGTSGWAGTTAARPDRRHGTAPPICAAPRPVRSGRQVGVSRCAEPRCALRVLHRHVPYFPSMSCRRRRATVEVESRREVEMSEMRVLKRVVVLLAAWTSLVLGVSTALDDGASTPAQEPPAAVDRKSTRLNSSH